MAGTVGKVTAYDLTVGVVVNMDEAIYMVAAVDSPMITGMDADGLAVIASRPVDEIQFSWMTDDILTPRSTLSGAVTTGDAYITVASGDQTKFSTGDSLKLVKTAGNEVVRITGYGTTADTLLVTRAYDGTTATNYASGAQVIGTGTALAEGADPENARSRDRDTYSNYTQIFGPTAVHMSRTEQRVRKYGVANEFAHQLWARTQENVISREQAFLYGRKTNSTTTKIRTTGGLDYFITTNEDSTSTQLTVATVQTRQQVLFNRGGSADRLMANPVSLADINDVGNTSIVRTTMEDSRRGRFPVETLYTEFGPVMIVRNRWVLTKDAFLFNRDGVVRRVLDPLQYEKLAKTGDSDKGQIVCEEGLQVKGETHMAKFSALGYAA